MFDLTICFPGSILKKVNDNSFWVISAMSIPDRRAIIRKVEDPIETVMAIEDGTLDFIFVG
jgi:hypothetical protein